MEPSEFNCPDCKEIHDYYGDCPTVEMSETTFKCVKCNEEQTVKYRSGWGDNLNYHCTLCGEYYKKHIRIPEFNIVSERWYRVPTGEVNE